MKLLRSLIRFARPHTIIATSLQVVGLFVIAGGSRGATGAALVALAIAFASALAANVYIVGLNQLTDIAIDRINKPYLPLAAGDFSPRTGRWIVAVLGLLAVVLAAAQGVYLLATVGISLIVGTIYSVRPVRLKERPFLAALAIAGVRGLVANVGFYLHFHAVLNQATPIPWLYVAGLALFFFGFGLVIALYKDIPDLAGDRQYQIRTFTVRLGPQRVFNLGRWLLTGFYLAPIGLALPALPRVDSLVLLAGHLLMLGLFWGISRQIAPADPASMTRFYLLFWGLFYAEYIWLALYEVSRVNGTAV